MIARIVPPDTAAARAKRYRDRAEENRRCAAECTDRHTYYLLMRCADDYERAASACDLIAANEQILKAVS